MNPMIVLYLYLAWCLATGAIASYFTSGTTAWPFCLILVAILNGIIAFLLCRLGVISWVE